MMLAVVQWSWSWRADDTSEGSPSDGTISIASGKETATVKVSLSGAVEVVLPGFILPQFYC